MGGFGTDGDGAFAWAELNTRGIDQAIAFYGQVFGWTQETMEATPTAPAYTTFSSDGEPVAGAMPMDAAMPPEVPSYWMPYFGVSDVDGAFAKAKGLGAQGDGRAGGLPGRPLRDRERSAGSDVRPHAVRPAAVATTGERNPDEAVRRVPWGS